MHDFNTMHYLCYLVEHISRRQGIHNIDTVRCLGERNIEIILLCADALHCECIDSVADGYIKDCEIPTGDFDITDTKGEPQPYELDIAAMYADVFLKLYPYGGAKEMEEFYSNPACEMIDYYPSGAYWNSTACIVFAFQDKHF